MVGGNKGFENNKKLNNFWVKLVRENSPTSRNPDLIRLILVDNGIIDAIWIPEESDYDNNYFIKRYGTVNTIFPTCFITGRCGVKPTIFGKSYQETGYMVSKKT
jgi:hypothetical protein